MSVDSLHAVAVVDNNFAAIAVGHGCFFDNAIPGSSDAGSKCGRDIDAGMEGALSVERILTLPERTRHATLNRPKRRSVGQARPIRCAGKGQSALQRTGNPAGHGRGAQRVELVDRSVVLLLVEI